MLISNYSIFLCTAAVHSRYFKEIVVSGVNVSRDHRIIRQVPSYACFKLISNFSTGSYYFYLGNLTRISIISIYNNNNNNNLFCSLHTIKYPLHRQQRKIN